MYGTLELSCFMQLFNRSAHSLRGPYERVAQQAKIPLTRSIWNGFLHVTVKALSSYRFIYFAESLYFVRSSIQLPTVKETDAQ